MKFLYNKGFLQNFAAILIAVLLIIGASVINLSKPSPVYATSCSVYDGNQGSCSGTTGCSWNDSCSTFNGNQGTCEATNGCSYPANLGDCSGYGDSGTCSSVPGCAPNDGDCTNFSDGGGDGSACATQPSCTYDGGGSGLCSGTYFMGCSGSYDNGTCAGTMTSGLCTGDFDDTAPSLSSSTVNLTSLTLTFDEALDSASIPSALDFAVYVNLAPVSIYSVNVTGTTVIVTLSQDVGIGTAVTIDYVPGAAPIQDSTGNDASGFSGQHVTNNSLPTISSVSPSSSSSINSVTTSSDVSFTVDANLASGSITATRTSGTADANSPHVCTLTNPALTAGNHTVNFSDAISGCTSNVSNLVSGAVYTFVFAGTDAGDNVANPVTSTNVTFDNTAPAAPGTPDLQAGSDLGASSTDNITKDNTPTFDISCESGATVVLDLDGNGIGNGTCSGGIVSITSSSLADSTHSIRAYQVDAAGNGPVGYSSSLSITVDTTRPSTSGIPDLDAGSDLGPSSTDNNTNDLTPTFTISCDDSSATVSLDVAGTTLGTGACNGSSATITSTSRPSGPNNFRSKQTDLAGNDSLAYSEYILINTYDTVPSSTGTPDLAVGSDLGDSSTDNTTNDDTPTFNISCTGNNVVTLKEGSNTLGTGTCSSSTVAITSSSLSDGTFSIKAIQTNIYGTDSADSSTLSVTVDTAAPVTSGAPDMTSGTDSGTNSDDITNDNTPTFTGVCTNGNTVQLFDDGVSSGSSATCASSVFSLTTGTLATGSNSITFKETDTAGNVSSASTALVVTIDTTSPTISEDAPIATGTDTTPAYTFSTGEAGTISYGGSCSSVTTSASSGSNTITFGTLAVGTYSDCTVIVTDTAGNASNTLAVTSFTINAPESDSESEDESSSTNNISGSSPSRLNSFAVTAVNDSNSNTDSPSKTPCLNGERFNTNTGLPCAGTLPVEVPGCAFGFNFSILTGKSCATSVVSPQTPSTPNTPNTPNTPSTYKFLKDIPFGTIRSEDARQLQMFLNTHNFPVALTGVGSRGYETRYFGPATRAALAKFQAFAGITPALGFFGPITRNYINGL